MALVIVDENTVKLVASYVESTLNVDGTPVQLAHTNIYVSVNSAPPVKGADIPATSVNGGGTVTVDVAIPAANGVATAVLAYSTETTVQGVEGSHSNFVTYTVDRKPVAPVVPAAPTGFTLG